MRPARDDNRRRAPEHRRRRDVSITLEQLDDRTLLSGGLTFALPGYPSAPTSPSPTPTMPRPIVTPTPTPTLPVTMRPTPVYTPVYTPPPLTQPPSTPGAAHGPTSATTGGGSQKGHQPTGIVTKSPHFYQFYTGPKLAELNAVKASGKLAKNGSAFTFTGTNRGRINNPSAAYVWGIDRSGNLSAGPFMGRPNIKFDALVVVSLNASLQPTASVTDLASGNTTSLPAGSARIQGKTVTVTVPVQFLPSTGLAPSHYRFNFWPESAGSVASFAPENTTVQVGIG